MSFGFSIGDIVLVSGAVAGLYNTIKNAPEEQQSLMIEVELLRQLTAKIAADRTLLSPLPIAGSSSPGDLIQTSTTQQLRRCFELLQNLDNIASQYIANTPSFQTPAGKRKSRSRVFRWGLYKRKEFVGLLGDLRNMISLLHMLQQNGNPNPEHPILDSVTYIEFTDALDRPWVCTFEHCNTYAVRSGQHWHSASRTLL